MDQSLLLFLFFLLFHLKGNKERIIFACFISDGNNTACVWVETTSIARLEVKYIPHCSLATATTTIKKEDWCTTIPAPFFSELYKRQTPSWPWFQSGILCHKQIPNTFCLFTQQCSMKINFFANCKETPFLSDFSNFQLVEIQHGRFIFFFCLWSRREIHTDWNFLSTVLTVRACLYCNSKDAFLQNDYWIII